MIVNPVVFGKSGAKTVEVTFYGANKTSVFWVDSSGTLTETKAKSGTIYPLAGAIFASSVELTVTNAELKDRLLTAYIYQANA